MSAPDLPPDNLEDLQLLHIASGCESGDMRGAGSHGDLTLWVSLSPFPFSVAGSELSSRWYVSHANWFCMIIFFHRLVPCVCSSLTLISSSSRRSASIMRPHCSSLTVLSKCLPSSSSPLLSLHDFSSADPSPTNGTASAAIVFHCFSSKRPPMFVSMETRFTS